LLEGLVILRQKFMIFVCDIKEIVIVNCYIMSKRSGKKVDNNREKDKVTK
jgi:hypothetical protein